ncbi:winged helix-turn-helix transcriptional regulator [Actinocrispum wychmicini]|uniref:winged helix-turn-helix transcriptional regulator n=1 Tax=Actinocrispum wychmicini TaxID=1213861 RepID=UPI001FB6E0CD|nr:winged-helix domain-containing protein [Actinocrispum wychmicini]
MEYRLVVHGQDTRICARCYDLTLQYLIERGVVASAVEVYAVAAAGPGSSGVTGPFSVDHEPDSGSELRVLFIEDDDRVRHALVPVLNRRGCRVLSVANGRQGLEAAYVNELDVVLLDLGLPDIDGIHVLRQLRAVSDVPVIVVSARGEVDDRVLALTDGADDYLVKPYDVAELLARMKRVVRRYTAGLKVDHVYDDGVLRLDSFRRKAHVAGVELILTATEFRLLEVLAHQAGAVQSVEKLLARVWGEPLGADPDRVKFAVSKLRRKLDMTDLGSDSLVSARGVGYLYQPPHPHRERVRTQQGRATYGHSARVLEILNAQDRVVRLGEIVVDLTQHEVRVAGRQVPLSRKEFRLLTMLASSGGAVCSRENLLTEIWGRCGGWESRSLDIHIATLRTKLGRPELIQVVRAASQDRSTEDECPRDRVFGYRMPKPHGNR